MKIPVTVQHDGKTLMRVADVNPEVVVTNRGYAHPAKVTVLGRRLHGFARMNSPNDFEFFQESHSDFCGECGWPVGRKTGKCRKGHLGPALRRLQDSGSPYTIEENE